MLPSAGTIPVPLPTALTPDAVQVQFSVVIPQRAPSAARPAYVSASTQSASIAVGNGTPTVVNCTTVCNGTVVAPVGNDTFTVKLYSGTNAGGGLLASGSTTQAILVGQANSIAVTLNGVVAHLAVAVATGATLGTAAAVAVTVSAQDASGNTIIGPGSYVDASGNPVTISLATSDATNAPLTVGTVTAPGTSVSLNYTGASIASADVTATATGLTTATATLAPAPVITSLSVTSGLIGTSVSETISGHFAAGNTTVHVPAGVTASNVTAGASSITATLFIDPEMATGSANITTSTTSTNATSNAQSLTVANTGVLVVTKATDATLGTAPGSCPAGSSGDLRYAVCNAVAGNTIVFDTTQMCAGATPCKITLGAALPPIALDLTIDGGTFGRVNLDGNSAYRAFFVDTGAVTIANLQIQNATAQGASNDSGAAGLGAGLFVNQATAIVNVRNVYFLNDAAVGGAGGSVAAGSNGAGGGSGTVGSSGATGATTGGTTAGAGGAGGTGGFFGGGGAGGAGGQGGGNPPVCYGFPMPICVPGIGFGGGQGGVGGSGGFGGGGGAGGKGGAGGGGSPPGPPGIPGNGGPGGPGGGGGQGYNGSYGGSGGALATVSGGNGDYTGGGGGAAAGPAIFVNAGSVTTTNSGASGSSATSGVAGGSAGATAGGSDATPVFNYAGNVNASSTTGPVASALGAASP